ETADLRKRVEELEEKQAELYHSRAEKRMPGLFKEVAEMLTIGGLVEVEAYADETKMVGMKTNRDSDIVLATVEVGIDAEVHEYVNAHVLLLWEEDDTEMVVVDEGIITITSPYGASVAAGRMYVPFGAFNSHMISDPMTVDLGETGESSVMLGFEHQYVSIFAGVFNGHVDEADDREFRDDFYGAVNITPIEGVSVGAYYISNIAESDSDITGHEAAGTTMMSQVAGVGGYVSLEFGPIMAEGEYLAATEDFHSADLDANGDGKGDHPKTWNLELAVAPHERIEVAARYEGSDEFFGFPDSRYGGAVSVSLFPNVGLALEFLYSDFEKNNGDGSVKTGTAQLGVEF
ncbi:MAG: LbtU family siderophore porin, partial [Thermodesulfobacteriota bacterium]